MRFVIVLVLAATFTGSASAQVPAASSNSIQQAVVDNAEMARLFEADQAIRQRFSKEGFSQELAI